MVISDKAALALRDAVAARGKHKGLLLAKAPKSNTLAYAAWQAAQISCNPFKASVMGISLLSEEQYEIYNEIRNVFEALGIKSLDRDRNALTRLRVW